MFYECAANDEILTLIYICAQSTRASRKAIPVAKKVDSYLHIVSVGNFHFYSADKFYPRRLNKLRNLLRDVADENIRTTK